MTTTAADRKARVRSPYIATHPSSLVVKSLARRLNEALPADAQLEIQTGWEITNQRGWKGRALADVRRLVCVEGPRHAVETYLAYVSEEVVDQHSQPSACTASVLALGVAADRFMDGADLRAAHGTILHALGGGHYEPVTAEMLGPDHHDWAMAGLIRAEMPHTLVRLGLFLADEYLPVDHIPDVLAVIPRIRDAYRHRPEKTRATEHPL